MADPMIPVGIITGYEPKHIEEYSISWVSIQNLIYDIKRKLVLIFAVYACMDKPVIINDISI